MDVSIDLTTVAISVIASSFGVAIAFYIKDYLERRGAYKRLKARLEKAAGKNAMVIYENPQSTVGVPKAMLYKIESFDEEGVTLKNKFHTVFIPIDAVLNQDIIIPCDNYEDVIHTHEQEEVGRFLNTFMPQVFHAVTDTLKKEFISEGTELNAVVGVKVVNALREAGIEVKQLPSKTETKDASKKAG